MVKLYEDIKGSSEDHVVLFRGAFRLAWKILSFLILDFKVFILVCPLCVMFRKEHLQDLRIYTIQGSQKWKKNFICCNVSCWLV